MKEKNESTKRTFKECTKEAWDWYKWKIYVALIGLISILVYAYIKSF